mmetsp:Transcript_44580/g.124036  ORF Transcript_44580/g.124036 Transcript_44580/m.124036 type:complete len:242 (-) Transcript_44580:357-1082(-)
MTRKAPPAGSRASPSAAEKSSTRGSNAPASTIRLAHLLWSAKLPRAPAAFRWAAPVPLRNKATKAAMPPKSAMAWRLIGIVARLWSAAEAVSIASLLPCSRMPTSAGMAPESATSTLLSTFLWHNMASAPAAFAWAAGVPARSSSTSGAIPFNVVINWRFFQFPAKFHKAAAACSLASLFPSDNNSTRGGIAPSSAKAILFCGCPTTMFNRAAAAAALVSGAPMTRRSASGTIAPAPVIAF